ncbi:MAG TPA: enoyl-CoA hydratase/isomerase family protein [Ktedonobacterales bacterium]|nr:enoyl-CoA hydratase/isomerase family protein [Ktedonobacterales bacterium]
MGDDLVVFERRGPAAVIRINREQKLNALNRPIFDALKGLLDQVAADDSLHAAILTGTGRAFCAGADIGEYWRQDLAAFAEFQRLGRELHDRIEKHPKPIIAAVNGFAFGGGFELALACDLIVASERAQFGLPELSLGLVPGGGGTQRLPRLIGRYRAKQVLLTGRKLTAREAEEWGVVAAVVPAGEEVSAAEALVGDMARLAPQAVRMGKRLINEGVDAALETALSYEQQALIALYATHDGQEGVAAFMEKRSPKFTGH